MADGQQAQASLNDDKEDEAPDFEVVEEGSDEARQLAKGGQVDAKDDEDDDEGGDERLTTHADRTRPDGEAAKTDKASKRKRQRERMKQQLESKDSLIRSLNQKLSQQNDRLSVIERRTGANEIAMVDKAINDTRALVDQAKFAHSQALTTGDPALVTEAMGQMYATMRQLENLEVLKQQSFRASSAPQATDQSVSRNVNAFMARNTWFRPDTGDEDSLIAKVLDNKVAEEGYDPRTQEYWDELSRRIAKKLPHRANGGSRDDQDYEDDDVTDVKDHADKNRSNKSTVSGSGSGGGQGGTRVKVVLSKERVQALKDSGMWDDVKQRNRMIKKYQEFDRQNQN